MCKCIHKNDDVSELACNMTLPNEYISLELTRGEIWSSSQMRYSSGAAQRTAPPIDEVK